MLVRSLLPIRKASSAKDCRHAMTYRYFHHPGDYDTRARYGMIRTDTTR
jgi:hypothetical protein